MASKKNATSYKPGESGNPKGRPALPAEIKSARFINQLEVDRMLNHVAFMNKADLVATIKDAKSPAILVGFAKIVEKVMKSGDLWAANFILDRMIGRPREAQARDVTPLPSASSQSIPGKRTFKEFCEKAGYPSPFEKQIEMQAFAFGENNEPGVLLGARGYGKTDYVTILGVAYSIYLDPENDSNLIITKSKVRNTAIVGEIALALKANDVELEKENSSVIRVKGCKGKDHSVEAITIRSSFRGRHPKRIIMDDPVTEEDVSSAQRALVERKYSEAYKLCRNITIIGQPAHAFDLYAKLRPTLTRKLEVPWGSIPELDADLDAMKLAGIDPVSIEMSYHLRVPVTGNNPFGAIKYIDSFHNGDSVAFIDPSDGGDYTAVSIIKGFMNGVMVQGRAWKLPWYHCLEDMIVEFRKRGVRRICFETNHAGTQPLDQLRSVLSPLGIGVQGVHSDTNKHATIMQAGSFAEYIHLSKESDHVYTNQVVQYEYGAEYDDAPDSLARCLVWLGLVKAKK